METSKRFYDYCVPMQRYDHMIRILKELYDNGYRTVAIEQFYTYITDAAGRRRAHDPIPDVAECLSDLRDQFQGTMRIISRLTIAYTEPSIVQVMQLTAHVKKFNIIAAMPMSEKAFKHAATEFNGDLICFNASTDNDTYRIPRKFVKFAIERDMFFEIRYSMMLYADDMRRRNIRIAHMLESLHGRGRNVILSSGANSWLEVRSPKDVKSLSFLFGYNAVDGKATIDRNGRTLFQRAAARRMGRTFGVAIANHPLDFSITSDEGEPSEKDDSEPDDDETDENNTGFSSDVKANVANENSDNPVSNCKEEALLPAEKQENAKENAQLNDSGSDEASQPPRKKLHVAKP